MSFMLSLVLNELLMTILVVVGVSSLNSLRGYCNHSLKCLLTFKDCVEMAGSFVIIEKVPVDVLRSYTHPSSCNTHCPMFAEET